MEKSQVFIRLQILNIKSTDTSEQYEVSSLHKASLVSVLGKTQAESHVIKAILKSHFKSTESLQSSLKSKSKWVFLKVSHVLKCFRAISSQVSSQLKQSHKLSLKS